MNWLVRADIGILALMLGYVVVALGLNLYRYFSGNRQTRAFIRDTANLLRGGAFEQVIRIAALAPRSHVATMIGEGLSEFISAASRFSVPDAATFAVRSFQRSQRKVLADRIVVLSIMKSIAYTAPLLGVAGTCAGLLGAFGGGGMEKHAFIAWIIWRATASLITTAAGLVAAVSGVVGYNFLSSLRGADLSRMAVAALEVVGYLYSHQQKSSVEEDLAAGLTNVIFLEHRNGKIRGNVVPRFSLLPRFSDIPPFPLMAAPSLILMVGAFTFLSHPYPPMGLDVHLRRLGSLVMDDRPSTERVSIVVRGSGANGSAEIFVNSKRTRPDELDAVLPRGLINASHVAYIRADGEVRWSDVVNVIDVLRGLHLDVILLTNRPGGRSAG